VRYDAFLIEDLFAEGSLAGIHVNHPDPWPKGRHAKHRLLGPAFLDTAARLLADGGELRIKTDFPPHLDAVAKGLGARPLGLLGRREDVLAEGAPWPGDVETNYQRKCRVAGRPVLAMWLQREARA
jgi:tRNA (guanine-N7-)-methyltransferase